MKIIVHLADVQSRPSSARVVDEVRIPRGVERRVHRAVGALVIPVVFDDNGLRSDVVSGEVPVVSAEGPI